MNMIRFILPLVICLMLAPESMASNGKVYVVLFMHNEDGTFGDIDDPAVRSSYLRHRQKLIEMSEYLNSNDVSFAWQSDWKFLELAMMYENEELMAETNEKNIVQWMADDMGIAVDAHSHEHYGYNYADVACLLDSLGVETTRIIGGHIWDPYNVSYADWERFNEPLQGTKFPHYFWEANVLMGSGTPDHTYDPAPSGIWRPKNKYDFWKNDPDGEVLCIGQYTGDIAGVEELVQLSQSGEIPESDILTCCIHTPQGFSPDFMDDFSTNLIEPLLAMQDAGEVEIVNFTELIGIWEANFASQAHLYNPLTDYVPDQFDVWVPGESAGTKGLLARVSLPEQSRYEDDFSPVVVHSTGGWDGLGITSKPHGLTNYGFIEIDFNFPGSGIAAFRSGGVYDHRGENCVLALKDIGRFALGLSPDKHGYYLSDMIGDLVPDSSNTGFCGWSNGGNATITAAGAFGDELPGLAWIVNWESPVGDGMPNVDAGGLSKINLAYNPNDGQFNTSKLKWEASTLNQNGHAGFLYFDHNENGFANPAIDYIPSYQYYNNQCYYSEWLRIAAEDLGVSFPSHIPSVEETIEFWAYRNGAYWTEEAVVHNPELMFIVEAGDQDHVQGAPDHPHILIQYLGFLNAGIRFARVNPDRYYVEQLLGIAMPEAVDNDGLIIYDHSSIRNALQPRGIPRLTGKNSTNAAICEIADRTKDDNVNPQIQATLNVMFEGVEIDNYPAVYPNPFNNKLNLSFELFENQEVKIEIYDLSGRRIDQRDIGSMVAGKHTYSWRMKEDSGLNIKSGVYLVRIQIGNKEYRKKVILSR